MSRDPQVEVMVTSPSFTDLEPRCLVRVRWAAEDVEELGWGGFLVLWDLIQRAGWELFRGPVGDWELDMARPWPATAEWLVRFRVWPPPEE